ncbi:MAG: response regulator [Brevundimonas sp.]|nr:MAG: response regulator [Brevundimonas sp.]
MFTSDRQFRERLEPGLRRVMVVDGNPHAAALIVDIIKGLGGRDVRTAKSQDGGLALARDLEPTLIFLERHGPDLNGEMLARAIRRSYYGCRRAPIIMVSAEAAASGIRGARDAGVHEFLRKPFTSADVVRRIENVVTRPRDWVEAVSYVGPDRRRFNSGEYPGEAKRKDDRPVAATSHEEIHDRAMRILAAALDQFDLDTTQALRAIREQAQILKAMALKTSDTTLASAVGALEVTLAASPANRATLTPTITQLMMLKPAPAPLRPTPLRPTPPTEDQIKRLRQG